MDPSLPFCLVRCYIPLFNHDSHMFYILKLSLFGSCLGILVTYQNMKTFFWVLRIFSKNTLKFLIYLHAGDYFLEEFPLLFFIGSTLSWGNLLGVTVSLQNNDSVLWVRMALEPLSHWDRIMVLTGMGAIKHMSGKKTKDYHL